ncbi:MAG: 2-oxoacid:ferredoxin oxidoreductase subunit beta, partial [Alphaproteobacteria bacterium]
MTEMMTQCLLRMVEAEHVLSDYQSDTRPRWCSGCGDNAILTAMQKLCRDENLA